MHHVTTLCVRLFGIYKELLVPVLHSFRIRKIASFGLLKKIKEPTSSGHFKNLKNQLFMQNNQHHLVVVWLVN